MRACIWLDNFRNPINAARKGIGPNVRPSPIDASFSQRYAVPPGTLTDFVLRDLKAHVPRAYISGDHATYTGFTAPGNPWSYTRIDFVFGGSNGKWYVRCELLCILSLIVVLRNATSYKVGTSLTDDGVLASDHRPVFTDITLEKSRDDKDL